MSAARQGIHFRGRKLYPYLEKIPINDLLGKEGPTSETEFSTWHKGASERLAESIQVEVGWSAKLINIILKVRVYIGSEGDHSLLALIHPPVDNRLIDGVCRQFSKSNPENAALRQLCKLGKPIKSMITYTDYVKVISGLRLVSARIGCTLFEVESLWSVQNEFETEIEGE
jgi:hypothetical protein